MKNKSAKKSKASDKKKPENAKAAEKAKKLQDAASEKEAKQKKALAEQVISKLSPVILNLGTTLGLPGCLLLPEAVLASAKSSLDTLSELDLARKEVWPVDRRDPQGATGNPGGPGMTGGNRGPSGAQKSNSEVHGTNIGPGRTMPSRAP